MDQKSAAARVARRIFLIAGVYGVLVLRAPLSNT